MKRYFVLIIILLISIVIYGQETEGEATIKRIKKVFKKEYSFTRYDDFNGNIEFHTENSVTIFRFDKELTISLYNTDSIFNILFAKGVLYPSILGGGKVKFDIVSFESIQVCNFESLDYTKPSPTKRRFSIWVFTEGLMNPNLYIIELTNDFASKDTELKFFLENCYLSYIKYGWTIL